MTWIEEEVVASEEATEEVIVEAIEVAVATEAEEAETIEMKIAETPEETTTVTEEMTLEAEGEITIEEMIVEKSAQETMAETIEMTIAETLEETTTEETIEVVIEETMVETIEMMIEEMTVTMRDLITEMIEMAREESDIQETKTRKIGIEEPRMVEAKTLMNLLITNFACSDLKPRIDIITRKRYSHFFYISLVFIVNFKYFYI